MGVEGDCVDVTIVRGDLGDDCCNCIVRSISFNDNRIIRVEMCQDGCLGEGIFEGLKCLGVVRAPGEWGVFSCEVNQGDDDVRKPHNELTIELAKLRNAWTALRLVGVGQMLTASVLACPWR